MSGQDHFEGVDLGPGVELTALVRTQLKQGTWRAREDGRPADWLARAWDEGALAPEVRSRLSAAAEAALGDVDPEVRAEAVVLAGRCAGLVSDARVLALARDRLEDFRGLRDGAGRDRSEDFARLVAAACPPALRGELRRLALDPDFGRATLPRLLRTDAGWAADNADRIAAADPAREASRVDVMVFRLRADPDALARLARALGRRPEARPHLAAALTEHVRDEALRRSLLAIGGV